MSTTDTRLSLDEAVFAAEKFRDLFAGCYDRWVIAGSVRRKKIDVGDIEHVLLPRTETKVAPGQMFPAPVDLVKERLGELRAKCEIKPHVYPDGKNRLGDKYSGFDWSCMGVMTLHELFMPDAESFGSALAIRTGPPDYSKRLVSGLLRNGRRNFKGQVWRCERCNCNRYGDPCEKCDGTGLVCVEKIAVPTEESFFALTGIAWVKPEDRT